MKNLHTLSLGWGLGIRYPGYPKNPILKPPLFFSRLRRFNLDMRKRGIDRNKGTRKIGSTRYVPPVYDDARLTFVEIVILKTILTPTLAAWPLRGHRALKSILWEMLLLNQLHDFSLLSLNSFLRSFMNAKFPEKFSWQQNDIIF